MSIFLTMAFMVLSQPTAKACDQLAQLSYLEPGFASEQVENTWYVKS
jgi:hypothetical protein